RTQLFGKLQSRCVRVQSYDACRAERLEDLNPEVTEAAHSQHDDGRARRDARQQLLHSVIGSDTGVREWRQGRWVGARRQPDDGAHVGPEKLRVAAVRAVEPGEEAGAGAVHVVADAAIATQTATWLRMQDNRITFGQARHSAANLLDPASVLVAEGE